MDVTVLSLDENGDNCPLSMSFNTPSGPIATSTPYNAEKLAQVEEEDEFQEPVLSPKPTQKSPRQSQESHLRTQTQAPIQNSPQQTQESPNRTQTQTTNIAMAPTPIIYDNIKNIPAECIMPNTTVQPLHSLISQPKWQPQATRLEEVPAQQKQGLPQTNEIPRINPFQMSKPAFGFFNQQGFCAQPFQQQVSYLSFYVLLARITQYYLF